MTDESTIKGWTDYASRDGIEAAVRKLFEIVDRERENANRSHTLYRNARDALWTAQYVEGDADLLCALADEITCGGNTHNCDFASYDSSCNAHECDRNEDAGDRIGCRWDAAAQLRAMAAALNALAVARKASAAPAVALAEGQAPRQVEREGSRESLNPLPPSTQGGGETDGILRRPSSPPNGRPETLATSGKEDR